MNYLDALHIDMDSIDFSKWVANMDKDTLLNLGNSMSTIRNLELRINPVRGDLPNKRVFKSPHLKITKFYQLAGAIVGNRKLFGEAVYEQSLHFGTLIKIQENSSMLINYALDYEDRRPVMMGDDEAYLTVHEELMDSRSDKTIVTHAAIQAAYKIVGMIHHLTLQLGASREEEKRPARPPVEEIVTCYPHLQYLDILLLDKYYRGFTAASTNVSVDDNNMISLLTNKVSTPIRDTDVIMVLLHKI